MVKVKTLPDEFDWLQLTPLDQLSPGINSLVGLLENAIGPEVRLIPLIAFGVRVAEGALSCVPCLCIPTGPFNTIADDVKDFFSRRRLLSSDNPWTFDPDQPCTTRPSEACEGFSICASDVFKPIADLSNIALGLFSTALRAAVNGIVLLFRKIPFFADIDDAFSHVADALGFLDFDFTIYANLNLPSFGTLAVPSVRLPTIPSTSDIVIVACVLVGAFAVLFVFGLGRPILKVAIRGAVLSAVIAFWSWVLLAVVFVYELRKEVVIFTGYEPRISFHTRVCIGYGVVLGLLAVSTATLLADLFIPAKSAALPNSPLSIKSTPPRTRTSARTAAKRISIHG